MKIEEIRKILISKEIYDPFMEELFVFQLDRLNKVKEFNNIPSTIEGLKQREEFYSSMFAKVGKGCYIEPPLRANLGGWNVYIGESFYANYNLTLVDDGEIFIGDNVLIGPNVTIATACHPISPTLRKYGLQYNLPVHIGNNVWIGSGAVILPGVSIGDNSIIGAGSIVSKDIPSNVVAFGNPCKVHREITEKDYEYYNHDVKIPSEMLKRYK